MSSFLEAYALPPPDTDDGTAGGAGGDAGDDEDGEEGAKSKKNKKKGAEGPPTLTEDDFGAQVRGWATCGNL